MIELCGRCGHENDHRGKKCGHEECKCPLGVRTDVFMCQQLAAIASMLARSADSSMKSQLLLQIATGQEVTITPKGNGVDEVLFKPFGPGVSSGSLILPGH